jgi:hypothetical protein
MYSSSAPGVYHQLIKPVVQAICLDKEVNALLDQWEEDGNCRNYDRAVYLAKQSNKLLGYSS